LQSIGRTEGDGGGDRGGDLRPFAGSPCNDSDSKFVVPAGLTADLAGLARYLDDPLASNTGVAGGSGGASIVEMGRMSGRASRSAT